MTPEDIAKLPYRQNVGVMVLNAQGQVFVGQRKDNAVAAWQMPQGGIDKGEDARTAALRELEEETGISPDLVTIVAQSEDWIPYDLPHALVPKLWKGRYRGQEQKWFLMQFSGTDADVNIQTEHPEFSAWRWLESADLVNNIVPFKRDVYVRVVEAFKEYL
ncbi:RNA pyrophosphohydrolase [Ascidiaceihabitans donghaensis]|uniref:RNA pyrophosphohydrolase n=1 Tax=Ascidiaceihabitans donghaensis TaxID=1510460 RepID=A0A2R8BIJ3_9RHOB|nr:RNA pyrophosphohydrolase [Ascidiaceihabitans donghaensis]SPH22809.1 RNA pyrophosphohydrolase [Ascidiaceihabitans donghaensis]